MNNKSTIGKWNIGIGLWVMAGLMGFLAGVGGIAHAIRHLERNLSGAAACFGS